MSITPVPVDAKRADWPRLVANAVKGVSQTLDTRETHPFQELAAAPASPTEGQAYYSLTDHKLRIYDGVTWQDLF